METPPTLPAMSDSASRAQFSGPSGQGLGLRVSWRNQTLHAFSAARGLGQMDRGLAFP